MGYAALYMGHATVVLSGPILLDDSVLDLSKTSWGAILGWGTAGTFIGKLSSGVLVDWYGGRRIFILALVLCVLATLMFATVDYLMMFCLTYFVVLFAKSAGWPSMANIISVWYPRKWHGRIWGILSSSSRLSSVFTSLVMGGMLMVISWRWALVISAVIIAIVAVLLFFTVKRPPAEIGLETIPSADENDYEVKGTPRPVPHHLDYATLGEALLNFVTSSRVWLICISVMCLAVLMEFECFMPIYIKETFNLSYSLSAITSSLFPIGCLVSVLLCGFIFDKINKKMRIVVLGSMMVLAILCIVTLMIIPSSNLTGSIALFISLAAIFLYGLAIAPCYYLPMSVFAVNFGGKRCAVLISIIDGFGYLAVMIFDFFGGAVIERVDGWHQFLNFLLAASIFASVALVSFLYVDYRSTLPQETLSKFREVSYA